MCKAPKPPPPPQERKPAYLVNPVLDAPEQSFIGQLRRGRSSLRTDLTIADRKAPVAPSVSDTRRRLEEKEREENTRELVDNIAGALPGFGGFGGI